MDNELFDFGFTLVDESELESAQRLETVESSVDEYQARLDQLYNAIQPLLANLKMSPDKEYILWPDRVEKIEKFETHIQKIYKGN
ncbi:MAG: hypothetical protein ACPH54_07850 [Candidatus Poseidoniaceae archaeon]